MTLSPAARISMGLVLLTVSILLIGDLIGVTPNPSKTALAERKKLSESLAVVFTRAAQNNDFATIEDTMKVVAERNDDVLSMALRKADGTLLAQAGDHTGHWKAENGDASTPTHNIIPILKDSGRWGNVEIRYASLSNAKVLGIPFSPLLALLAFVSLSGFVAYRFFIGKTLRHLDPSSVIPGQVQSALDVLAEGVVIFDKKGQIVLTNSAFAAKVGKSRDEMLGKEVTELGADLPPVQDDSAGYPWMQSIHDGTKHVGVKLEFKTGSRRPLSFMINSAPILDGKGEQRGALATFDDVTQLEEKNTALQEMLEELQHSQDEVTRQNEKLKFLATRDPMTGCLNRRSFFEQFEVLFNQSRRNNQELCCVMADIDHFKMFNDAYGHTVGDEVIKRVAMSLQSTLRDSDLLCRYGGEEFCILIPGADIELATKVAERTRRIIEAQNDDDLLITASFGISSIKFDARAPTELINQADRALYVAKGEGRNTVRLWEPSQLSENKQIQPAAPGEADTLQDAEPSTQPAQQSDAEGARSQTRLQQLEENNRWYTHTLEMLSSMDKLYGAAATKNDPQHIYDVTRHHTRSLLSLNLTAFLTVNEDDSVEIASCDPEYRVAEVREQVKQLVDSGQYSEVLSRNHTVEARADETGQRILLHALATSTRLHGMFMGFLTPDAEPPSAGTYNILSLVMQNCANALETTTLYGVISEQNRELEQTVLRRTHQLEHEQLHDNLTGLPNRLLFNDRIVQSMSRSQRNGTSIAVLLLDIDMFKRINDTLGHVAGDQLLIEAGHRLSLGLRITDSLTHLGADNPETTLSRLGGDEFAFVLTDIKDIDSINSIAKRSMDVLAQPFTIDSHEIHVTTSIGISVYPNDGDSPGILIKNAETAMYHAKKQRGDSYRFYAEKMNATALHQLELESRLRRAIRNEEFLLHYQPKVDPCTGRITSLEALVRWHDPNSGLVIPGEFIPIAENTGLIMEIGAWVLREACHQTRAWQAMGLDVQIAVNLSGVQFRQHDICDQIVNILGETGLEPQSLELEITESTIMDDLDAAVATMQQLADAGVNISIDDFGTGYSSLNHLKRFPIRTLKIDRSFVSDIGVDANNETIVTAIISLAHNMGLTVVAEGVETEEQLAFLHHLKCDEIQGYLFSKPLPVEEVEVLLEANRVSPLMPEQIEAVLA